MFKMLSEDLQKKETKLSEHRDVNMCDTLRDVRD